MAFFSISISTSNITNFLAIKTSSTQKQSINFKNHYINFLNFNLKTTTHLKAFIPDQLPDDFLRITLNGNQVANQQRHQHQHQTQHQQQIIVDNAYGLPFGYPSQPRTARGRLTIHLLEAKLNKNYGFLNKMDLYVRINMNGKIFQTETEYGAGKTPKWNKAIACFIPHGVDSFIMEIYDERTLSSDEQIAMLHYVFPDDLFDGTPIDEWFPLSGKLGEQKEGHIHLRLMFTVGFFVGFFIGKFMEKNVFFFYIAY